MLTGPDVSHWQGRVNWAAVAGAGHAFALIKATEGRDFVDPQFRNNWAAAHSAGVVRGAYHFLRFENDPAAQARFFVDVTGDLTGSLAALDVERSATGTNAPYTHVNAFAAEFARLTGGHPLIIYTGRWYWVGVLGNPQGAHLGPLWHSEYDSGAEVDDGPELAVYGAWPGPTFWQFTNAARCPGIAGACDMNLFYGERPALLALTALQEDDMPLTTDEIRAIGDELEARLNKGTAFGQVSWAGTSAATLQAIQHVINQNVAILREAKDDPDVDEHAVAADVADQLLPQLLAGLGDVVDPDELVDKLTPALDGLLQQLTTEQLQRFLAKLAELAAQTRAEPGA